jgi:pyruvate kinase
MTRRAKIVCTIGPATASPERIRALVDAGMDVARLNFSHGTHEQHAQVYELVRRAARDTGRAVGILADLQGPKIRLGTFEDGPVEWATGASVVITTEECVGSAERVGTTYKQLSDEVSPGDRLLIDDGKLELEVAGVDGHDIRATVLDPRAHREGP